MGIIETKLGRLLDMPSPGKLSTVDVTSISETLSTSPISRALSSRTLAWEHVLTEDLPISLAPYISTLHAKSCESRTSCLTPRKVSFAGSWRVNSR
jgi:hypothetical protein